jgi:hypothetical protein
MTMALPIDKDVVHLLNYVHTLNTKTIRSNLNSLNTFTKETSSSNVTPVLLMENLQKTTTTTKHEDITYTTNPCKRDH